MPSPASPPRTRLFSDTTLAQGITVACDEKRAHYLQHVLRLREGTQVVLFNGKDGEWLATLEQTGKKSVSLTLQSQLRAQANSPDLWLLAAPLKNGRTDWVVEKATELGITRFCAVTTQFAAVDKINETRLRAIAVEAAEQCERMDVPAIEAITSLDKRLSNWPQERMLIYADESGSGASAESLQLSGSAHAVLVGPEGGFSKEEFLQLRKFPFARALTLGPRILRADTAALAAVTLIQAACGDWDTKPAFRNQET